MKIDMSGIEQMAAGLDPSAMTDPSKMEELLSQGMFEPKATPSRPPRWSAWRRCWPWSRAGCRRW